MSGRLKQKVRRDFGEDAGAVIDQLTSVPTSSYQRALPEDVERIQAALAFRAAGDRANLREITELERTDWRDASSPPA